MLLNVFLPALKQLPANRSLSKKDILTSSFHMASEKDLTMYYSPHNDYINRKAIIILVGITPGWSQMKTAFETFIAATKEKNESLAETLPLTKQKASFAGTMRENLINMLDESGLHSMLGLASTAALFHEKRQLLHTTSLIKYPVFYKEKNYTGHQPSLKGSKLLSHYVYSIFPDELQEVSPSSLIIPLGKKVEEILYELALAKKIKQPFLTGFPHPSGANGHRLKQFAAEKQAIKKQLSEWSHFH